MNLVLKNSLIKQQQKKNPIKMSESVVEEPQVPEFLLDLLNEIAKRENFIDYKIDTSTGSNIGDGFQGLMIRIKISGSRAAETDAQLALICKIPPLSEFRRKYAAPVFQKEILMYEKILPIFVKFQKEKGIQAENGFYTMPKCYGTWANEETFEYAIVLEDLKHGSYDMWNKFEKLNFAHAKMTVSALGRFHAISFGLRDQRPDLFAEINHIQSENIKNMNDFKPAQDFMNAAYDMAIKTLRPDEINLIEKMTHYKESFTKHLLEAIDIKGAEPFGVLNHGDFWNNNMMFQYATNPTDRQIPDQVCFIDWQMSQFCSPATDLSYYLNSSTEKELRDKHFDDLLRTYYDSLAKTITLLGSDPSKLFTYEQFLEQYRKFSIYGFLMAPVLVQVVTVEANDIPDMDALTEDSTFEFMGKGASPRYTKRMADVIRDFFARS